MIVLWCNGSTTGFGSVCLGSNPGKTTSPCSLKTQSVFKFFLCPHISRQELKPPAWDEIAWAQALISWPVMSGLQEREPSDCASGIGLCAYYAALGTNHLELWTNQKEPSIISLSSILWHKSKCRCMESRSDFENNLWNSCNLWNLCSRERDRAPF